MKAFLRRQNYLVLAILVLLMIVASMPIYWQRIMNPVDGDYGTHILYTYQLLKEVFVPSHILAHPAVQIILGGLVWASRSHVQPELGMVILMVASNVFLALIVYFWLGESVKAWVRIIWAFTLPFLAPVMALVPLDNHYYYGYIGLANYHNPTIQLLHPVALLVFILALQVFRRPRNPSWMIVLAAILVVLSALVKPNYLLCILPAMAVLGLVLLLRRQPLDVRMGLLGFALPAAVVLGVQWYVTYAMPGADNSHIIFLPLVVEQYFSNYLPWKFLLSILFPLVVLILTARQVIRDRGLQLAWLSFVLGALQLYLLAESGDRLYDANFRWSAQITLFVLIVACVRFVMARLAEGNKLSLWKKLVAYSAYGLQFVAGIVYYIYCVISIHYG
jgi:hypothetical protein